MANLSGRIRELVRRVAGTFWLGRSDADLREELQSHLEMAAEGARRDGASIDDAKRAATIWHGGIAQAVETQRDQRGFSWIADAAADVRYGARQLRKHPGFSVAVVLTLALGLGANVALFIFFDAFFLRPLPVHEPQRLVNVHGHDPRFPRGYSTFSFPDYLAYRSDNRLFSDLIASLGARATLNDREASSDAAGQGSNSSFVPVLYVTDNFFSVLRPAMALGHPFTESGARIDTLEDGIVLSHRYWSMRFSADPAIVGKIVHLNSQAVTVLGVASPEFMGTEVTRPVAGWAPIRLAPGFRALEEDRENVNFNLVGQLKPDIARAQGEADLQAICRLLRQSFPQNGVDRISLVPAGTAYSLAAGGTGFILVVFGAFAAVLLIACANVANLLLARGATRHREVAIRLATGATRGRLARQCLAESLLLAALGGITALLMGSWTFQALYSLTSSAESPSLTFGPSIRLVGFVLVAGILTALATGLAPALAAGRVAITSLLQGGGSLASGRIASSRLRNALIVIQVAMSLMLLVAGGMFVRNLAAQMTVDVGLDTAHGLTVVVEKAGDMPSADQDFARQMEERLAALPGVVAIGRSNATVFGGENNQPTARVAPVGVNTVEAGAVQEPVTLVSPNYLSALGVPLVRGRMVTAEDAAGSNDVVVVSESAARRFWANQNPLDQQIQVELAAFNGQSSRNAPNDPSVRYRTCKVIGVVRDAAYASISETNRAHLFLPLPARAASDDSPGSTEFQLRVEGDPQALMKVTRTAVESAGGLLTAQMSLEETLASSRAPAVIGALLAGGLGLLGFSLAAVGLFGVIAFNVNQRTREIGIRMAIGAAPRALVRAFVRQGMRLVALGAPWGLLAGYVLSRWIGTLFQDPLSPDLVAIGSALLVLFGLTLFAIWLPARRAARVDPLFAMRHE